MSESHLTTRHPDEDIRSRTVVDAAGHDIGEIEALRVDIQHRRRQAAACTRDM
jgi:hypothetical protein